MAAVNGLVVLVDDVRTFRDGRVCISARTVQAALDVLERLLPEGIDDLWLDYDLGEGTTAMPIVARLVEVARDYPLRSPVRTVHVHSANAVGARAMTDVLRQAGYRVEREYNRALWMRASDKL